MTTGCYLLHFEPSYKHAKHYLGYADDVEPRVHAHLHGRGARLTQVAHHAGVTMILVRVWVDATRKTERTFKNRSHVPILCPICRGEVVQLPLMPWMPAQMPEPEPFRPDGHDAQTPQDGPTLWQVAEAEEYEENMRDREDWARGGW